MSNEYFARQALKELGITRTNRSNVEYQALIDNIVRAEERAQQLGLEADDPPKPVVVAVRGRTELTVTPPPRAVPPAPPVVRPVVPPNPRGDGRKRGSSKSTLAPVLRGEGTLEKRSRTRKRGRPRVVASWFAQVAATMAEKRMSLPEALKIHAIELDATQLRALQRNAAFLEMRQQARRNRRQQPSRNLKISHPDGE